MARFTSFHRFSPFWNKPASGTTEAEVQPETLWLLAETDEGRCTMVVPLLDSMTRYSLRGSAGGLTIAGETGDPAVVSDGGVALLLPVATTPMPWRPRVWKQGECHLFLRDGGAFLAWAARQPSAVLCDDHPVAFSHEHSTGRLAVELPAGQSRRLIVRWS